MPLDINIHFENASKGGAFAAKNAAMPVSIARITENFDSTRGKKLSTN